MSQPGKHVQRRRIMVRGLVQGVGFRPHVYRCAHQFNLAGFVQNHHQGVLVEVEGDRNAIADFLQHLRGQLPPLARIDALTQLPIETRQQQGFTILPSTDTAATGIVVPPDTGICDACLNELFSPRARRYLHPFISCSHCGPRYSLIQQLPYDRANTSMAGFVMCPQCRQEYECPDDRRFYAEQIACHHCGPKLSHCVTALAQAIKAGKIVAIKGVGGYHLACDAHNAQAVQRLREHKKRDAKPLAIMVLNVACASECAEVSEPAAKLLQSIERPIVVLPQRQHAVSLGAAVSPKLGTLGVMLPYTGTHYLLFHALLGAPDGQQWLTAANHIALVMTSANSRAEPIIAEAEVAETQLAGMADVFLHHDREIINRVDDSVLRVAPAMKATVRMARGYTPHAIELAKSGPSVLALGAYLKTTITVTDGDRAYVSPHIGDLESAATQRRHAQLATAMQQLLHMQPDRIACDLHRDFASTRLAERLADQLNVPLFRVQHHHAHVAAVLAEHQHEAPALGVALDGYGEGVDGMPWGGELLMVDGACCERLGHLAPMPLPGGDTAAREPWRMAAAVLHSLGRNDQIESRFFMHSQAPLLAQLLNKGHVPMTTSAGRLFDAAAGLLGVCSHARFEGEAPMQLEALLPKGVSSPEAFSLHEGVLDFSSVLSMLADCSDQTLGAAIFHTTLVHGLMTWVVEAAHATGVRCVALSGGCFLNAYLATELSAALASKGLTVLQARALPPNDGAISLGQAWVAQRS